MLSPLQSASAPHAEALARVNTLPKRSPKGLLLVSRSALRPARLGNPRRKAEGLSCPSPLGEGPRRQPRSLDSSNHLATSSLKSVHDVTQEADHRKWTDYQKSCWRQAKLLQSLWDIVRQLEGRIERMETILFSPVFEQWLKNHPKLDGKLQNKYVKLCKHRDRRIKDHERLAMCHDSWIALKPVCCDSRPLAVPVVCNHRLCFLCNGRRAERYRDRVRVLFDRLDHPAFLTITIPNIPMGSLRKRVYTDFRYKWNKLRKKWAGYMQGGIFAFETTFNNLPDSKAYRTWHVHAHVLIDGTAALPVCKCRERIIDSRTGLMRRKHAADCAFIGLKRRLEFNWLCLTQGNRGGERWRPSDFNYWFSRTFPENWRDANARHEWNAQNRRTIDIRRVTDRKKAAYEVLKYATKGAHFADIPAAVNEFIDATKNARMVQTFGTWYGFDFDDETDVTAGLECGCGENKFERVGVIFRMSVEMDRSTGKWHPKQILSRCIGPPGQT